MNALAGQSISEPRDQPRTTIRITGVLDMAEAQRLAEFLKHTPGQSELHVDLGPARETHDAAVVALARALRGRNAVILGLSRHQERLLDYVGEVIALQR